MLLHQNRKYADLGFVSLLISESKLNALSCALEKKVNKKSLIQNKDAI